MNVAIVESVVPANKPRKENTHQQDFLLVFAVKSLRKPNLCTRRAGNKRGGKSLLNSTLVLKTSARVLTLSC